MKWFASLLLLVFGTASLTAQQPLSQKFYKWHGQKQINISSALNGLKAGNDGLKSGSSTDLPEKTVRYDWVNSVWEQKETITTNYTVKGQPRVQLHDMVTGNDQRITLTYDQQDALTEQLTQSLDNGVWKDSLRDRYEYNDKHDITLNVSETYSGNDWVIIFGEKVEYEYSGDQITREVDYMFVTDQSQWIPNVRYTNNWVNGKLVNTVEEEYVNGTWVTVSRYIDFNGASGKPDSSNIERWTGSAWVPAAKQKFTYTGEMGYTIIMYEWDTVNLVYNITDRWKTEYDLRGELTSFSWEIWSGTDWVVMVGVRSTDTLEGVHLVARVFQSNSFDWLTGSPGAWVNYYKEVYSQFIKLGTDPLTTSPPGITCYPNPAGKSVSVRFLVPDAGNVVLTVYSLSGQKLMQQTYSTGLYYFDCQLNLDNIRSGSYLLKATDTQGRIIGETRLIKQ